MANTDSLYADFAFDEDFLINNSGELMVTKEVPTKGSNFSVIQAIEIALGVATGDLEFHQNYGARLDRLFGRAITSSLIEFGKLEIRKSLNLLLPFLEFQVDGYYTKELKSTIIYTIKRTELSDPITNNFEAVALLDMAGSVNVFGV